MLTTKAIFERKTSDFDTRKYVIEGIEIMDRKEFEEFSSNLLEDRNFIEDRKDEMYVDGLGQVHVLLSLNMDSDDGILSDSQGHNYTRYASFMPISLILNNKYQ